MLKKYRFCFCDASEAVAFNFLPSVTPVTGEFMEVIVLCQNFFLAQNERRNKFRPGYACYIVFSATYFLYMPNNFSLNMTRSAKPHFKHSEISGKLLSLPLSTNVNR